MSGNVILTISRGEIYDSIVLLFKYEGFIYQYKKYWDKNKSRIETVRYSGDNVLPCRLTERFTMKVTIGQLDSTNSAIWESEALAAKWDRERNEFVISSDINSETFSEMVNKRKLAVEIEDSGPSKVTWRGYVGTADFLLFESQQIDCCLIMLLDDWFGIVPQFSTS